MAGRESIVILGIGRWTVLVIGPSPVGLSNEGTRLRFTAREIEASGVS